MAHPSEELLRQAYAAWSTGDMEALANLLSDDTVFHISGRSLISGEYRGKREALRYLRKLGELASSMKMELHDVLASDDHAIGLVWSHAERGGKRLEMGLTQVFHVRDGRLSEFWLHPDNQYGFDDFWS